MSDFERLEWQSIFDDADQQASSTEDTPLEFPFPYSPSLADALHEPDNITRHYQRMRVTPTMFSEMQPHDVTDMEEQVAGDTTEEPLEEIVPAPVQHEPVEKPAVTVTNEPTTAVVIHEAIAETEEDIPSRLDTIKRKLDSLFADVEFKPYQEYVSWLGQGVQEGSIRPELLLALKKELADTENENRVALDQFDARPRVLKFLDRIIPDGGPDLRKPDISELHAERRMFHHTFVIPNGDGRTREIPVHIEQRRFRDTVSVIGVPFFLDPSQVTTEVRVRYLQPNSHALDIEVTQHVLPYAEKLGQKLRAGSRDTEEAFPSYLLGNRKPTEEAHLETIIDMMLLYKERPSAFENTDPNSAV